MSVHAPSKGPVPARFPKMLAAGGCFLLLSAPIPGVPSLSTPLTRADSDFRANAVSFMGEAELVGPRAPSGEPRAAQAALALNQRIPFAAAPFRLAPAFVFTGDSSDRVRATDCLAAAAYYEAGRDGPGQQAVIQVVLNRVRNAAYPGSICGVVFQGSERTTGCQFTFTCDGSMTRRRPSAEAWGEARRAANMALSGYSDAAVGHATHYHTDWVHPRWSSTLDKVAAVRTHLFFQARAERPGDFSSPYAGKEPQISALAWLSAAHRSTGNPISSEIQPVSGFVAANPRADPAVATGPVRERLPDRAEPPDAGIFLVTLDRASGADSFRQLAERMCAGRDQCKLIGWIDGRARPAHFPIPGTAVDTISFTFTRAGTNTPDKVRWNCREFPRADPAECLYRTD